MPAVTITEALRVAAASQLLVLIGLLLRHYRRSRISAASCLLAACVACYLILPALRDAGMPGALCRLVGAGALAVPFAFWLAARIYFDDGFELKAHHGVVLLGLLAVRAAVLPWPIAAAGVAIVLVADALRHIHAGSAADLLVSRLRLRYAVLLGTGLYALLVLFGEATLRRGTQANPLVSGANDIGLFLLVTTVSMMVLRVEPELVRSAAKRPTSDEPPTILEKKLDRLIDEEQVFKTEGLTIGALAEKLGEQEYKVRHLINARLGFRNFGAFLNHYRIRAACKVLSDPRQKQLGIAEVAYRFGYA